ncbi:MAG: tetratricopeptide repeat protein, partial [Desulfarculaceae bacterium]|nr:tetratricopeptide repeat protein [Desulfarculaceae bacterium]
MSSEKLIKRALQLLDNGNARDAVSCYRQAEKNGAPVGSIRPGLMDAYLLRHGQLEQKRMYDEADAVMENCFALLPDPVDLPVDTVKKIIEKAPVEKSVSLYLKLTGEKKVSSEIDRLLANRVVLSQRTELLDSLPDGPDLKQDREVVEKTLPLMIRGEWGRAADGLAPLGRKSPYCDIKLFAKLMKAFAANEDSDAVKACTMLSSEFPLKTVPVIIQAYAQGGQDELPAECNETLTVLFGEGAFKRKKTAAFEQAGSTGGPKKIKRALDSLLSIFSPHHTESDKIKTELVALAGFGLLENGFSLEALQFLVNETHFDPEKRIWLESKIITAKYGFFTDYAYDYIDRLSFEFSGKVQTDMAKAEILCRMAKTLKKEPGILDDSFYEIMGILAFFGIEQVAGFHGCSRQEKVNLAVAKLAEKALSLDPENRQVCELLLDLPFEFSSIRKLCRHAVESLVAAYPDDPLPCLGLAEIHYRKNAFRKAENILQTAFERAPHDNRVKKRYALSFLVAGSRNLARKKMAAVADDFEKAGQFGVESLKEYVAQKKMMLDMVETGRFSRKVFDRLTDGFVAREKLKTLLLLKMELDDPVWSGQFNLRGIQSLFDVLVRQIKTLFSKDLASVLKPVPKEFQLIYKDVFPAAYLVDAKKRILANLSNRDLADLIIDFIDNGYEDAVLAELERRRKKLKKRFPADLDFYYVALLHMEDEHYFEPREFFRILDALDEKEKEKIRFISRKLAPYASGVMRDVFERFDFSLLEYPFPGQKAGGSGFDDIDDFFGKMIDMMADDGEEDDDDFRPDEPDLFEKLEKKLDLKRFDVENVFGKTGSPEKIRCIIADLASCSEMIVYGDDMVRAAYVSVFMEEFDSLVQLLEKDGSWSFDEIRKAGKRLARELSGKPSANYIVEAFKIAGKKFAVGFPLKVQYFILGMKTEV